MKHSLLSVAFAVGLAMPAFAEDYMIMAPAAPGGGWDGTARAMQEVMQAEGISASVQVQNVPGAGGTVGLAQFASTASGDPGSGCTLGCNGCDASRGLATSSPGNCVRNFAAASRMAA